MLPKKESDRDIANSSKHYRQALIKDFLLILVVTSIVLLFNLGVRPLVVWDEGLYCGTTQDMHFHSQWLFPTIDGEFSARYGKPPFVNWLQGISSSLIGWSKFSLRLPTALGMLGLVLLTWLTGVLIAGRWVGLIAVCILLFSRHFMGMGITIWLENLVAPFFAASLLCYGKDFGLSRRIPFLGTILAGLFTGMAILTKQSFGLFAPAALVVVELIRRRPGMVKRIFIYSVAVGVSCGWWFLLTASVVGSESWQSWFGYHVVERFTDVVEGHTRYPYSFATALQKMLDGTPWVVGLIGWVFLLKNTPQDTEARDLLERWTALVVIEYIVVGLVSQTFLSWYQLVIVLPFAIGSAYIIVESFRNQQYPLWIRWMLPLLIITNRVIEVKRDAFLVALICVALIWCYETFQLRRFWKPALSSLLIVGAGIFALRATTGYSRPDTRAILARDLSEQSSLIVLAKSPLWRIWKCYLPQAVSIATELPCNEINKKIEEANIARIVIDSPQLSCPLTGFHSVKQVKQISIWEKNV